MDTTVKIIIVKFVALFVFASFLVTLRMPVLAIQVLAEFLRAKIVVTMCKSIGRPGPALSIALIVIPTRVNIRGFIFGANARRVLQLDVFWIRILCIWNGNDVLAASSIFFF